MRDHAIERGHSSQMIIRQLCAGLAVTLTFYAFLPYIRDILRGKIKPHVFSWVIWGVTTFVVFFAQWRAGGGLGAWVIGLSGTLTLFIAALAWIHRGDLKITRLDWAFFVGALSSLPLWYATSDPLWAVVVLTAVDLLGFGPTVRKAIDDPHAESPSFFALFLARNALVVVSLETRSLTTALFPVAVGAGCALVIVLIVVRRRFSPAKTPR
jgi:hypothetical protein